MRNCGCIRLVSLTANAVVIPRGLMYYDSDEDKVKLCKGPAGLNNWQDLGGDTWTHDGTVVRLTTFTDTVGIGTANPQAKLEVVGGEVRIPGGSGDLSDFATAFRYLGTGANYIRGNTYIADNGGNVGIGTADPQAKLEVVGEK